ncbi:hypothetical protein LJC74_09490, partial [Eubacteriales bacterium OttesenSCG-928-A19]|nr:hypothetical protein [Eubacteriales bacterium OttesenSCG-928-A19]
MRETTADRRMTERETDDCLALIETALRGRGDADVEAARRHFLPPLHDQAALAAMAASNVAQCLQTPSFENGVQTLRYAPAEVEVLAVATRTLLERHPNACAFHVYARELLTALYLDRRIYGHAMRILLDRARAEDALQELFCRLLYPYGREDARRAPKLLRYDPSRRFESWFLVVRTNFLHDLLQWYLTQSARQQPITREDGAPIDLPGPSDDPAHMEWDNTGVPALVASDGFLEAYARAYAARPQDDPVRGLYLSCLCECGLNRLRAQRRANAELSAMHGGKPPRVTDYYRERWYYEMLDALIAALSDRLPDSAALLRMYLRIRPGKLPLAAELA